MTIFRNLNTREFSIFSELLPRIQGVETIPEPTRFYPEKDSLSHSLGYVGLQDREKAEDKSKYFYYIPDQIGKTGIEKKYGRILDEGPREIRGLRGIPGKSLIRVDHLGFIHETYGEQILPKSGHDLILTIDWKAQKIAEKLLDEKTGVIILLDADTGAILVMASAPTFNLQDFVPWIPRNLWNNLNNSPAMPLLNRATVGTYTPGSIIKPLVAMALLEDGTVPEEEINCEGAAYIGNARIRCWSWRSGGHGKINIVDAIKQSCNVFFIQNGRKLGLEKIAAFLKTAGIGQPTGDVIVEAVDEAGNKMTEDKMRIFGQRWNEYDTALLSMGQGIILLSPLQVAVYTAAIANGGILRQPYIVKEMRDSNGNTLFIKRPKKTGTLGVSPENLDIVREGMWRVVNSDTGSAKKARNDFIELSGKTGTAEMGPRSKRYTNTWFISYGEYHKKRYALVVFIEKGKSGGRTCAPITSEFFNQWLSEDRME